jgi:WD40 repeat protein
MMAETGMKRLTRQTFLRTGARLLLLALLAAAPPAACAQDVKLTPVWVRVADAAGAENKDNETASVETAEFSPDGRLVVSGSKGVMRPGGRVGQAVKLWRVAGGKLLWERPRADELEAVAFTRDGRFVAAGGEDNRCEILSVKDGSVVATLEHPASIDGLRFTPDGKFLLTGCEDQHARIWRTSDWKLMHTIKHGGTGDYAINSIDFTRDGKFLVTGGTNGEAKIWHFDAATGDMKLARTIPHPGHSVKSARISPDGKLLAAGLNRNGGVKVYDFADGRQVAALKFTLPPAAKEGVTMEAVEWTPDGKYLVTGGSEGKDTGGAKDGYGFIRFYRTADLLAGKSEPAHVEEVFRQEYIHFTRDGKLMLTGHEDGTVRVWRVDYAKPQAKR